MNKKERNLLVKRCREDPVFFLEYILNVKLWSKQVEIIESVRDNDNTCVSSGHGLGKSFAVACTTLWFLFCHNLSRVITTAPTWKQVESILWAEIAALYNNSRVPLGGKLLKASLSISEKHYALGISTDDGTRFQGHHSEHLLLIMDEAPGIDPKIYEASKGILTQAHSKSLLIGNPTSSSGPFFDAFKSKFYNPIHISCYDSPAIEEPDKYPALTTTKWIEERKEEWGEGSPMFISRVLGEFPEEGEDTLIPLNWCERAVRRGDVKDGSIISDHIYLGLDVARYGSNKTVLTTFQPNCVRSIRTIQNRSTVDAVNMVIAEGVSAGIKLMQVTVDDTGVGCVACGTNILTPDGPREIQDLKVGDEVLSEGMTVECVESIVSYKCDVLSRGGVRFAPGHFMRYKTHGDWIQSSWDDIIKRKAFYLDGRGLTEHNPFVDEGTEVSVTEDVVYNLGISGQSKLFACMFDKKVFWTHNGGVTDRLRELGYAVLAINFSQRTSDPFHFRGIRDELYWHLRELFRADEIAIPNNEALLAQLSALRYKINPQTGRIEIESKDDMKKRGLKSPDEADSLAIAVWGSKRMKASSHARRRSGRAYRPRDTMYY